VRLTPGWLRPLIVLLALLVAAAPPVSAADEQEQFTIEGDLVLRGDETLTIRDKLLDIKGGIYVQEQARLRLENVRVRFIDSDLKHKFVLNGSSAVELVNTSCGYNIRARGASKLLVTDSSLYLSFYCRIHKVNHTSGGAYAYDDSELTIIDSDVGVVSLWGNAKAEITGSEIYSTNPNGLELTIVDSTVERLWEAVEGFDGVLTVNESALRDLDMDDFFPGSRTRLRNSSVTGELWLSVNESNITFIDSDLSYVYLQNGTLLSVEDSRLKGIHIHGTGDFVSIRGSRVGLIRSTGLGRESRIRIQDSVIGEASLEFSKTLIEVVGAVVEKLNMESLQVPLTYEVDIRDTVIGCFTPGFGEEQPIHYRFSNVTLRDTLGFRYGAYHSTGGAMFTGSIGFGPEFRLNMTMVTGYAVFRRNYGVTVTGGGKPIPGAVLSLVKGESTLWTGETDAEGAAEFPVTFARIFAVVWPYVPGEPSYVQVKNITDTVTLKASAGGMEVETEIGFDTDTPIVVEVGEAWSPADLLVLLLAASILLLLYWGRRT
jgi:hypothetical protein